jgi:hypothetical protein
VGFSGPANKIFRAGRLPFNIFLEEQKKKGAAFYISIINA